MYILARLCPDYASLVRVFSEIKKRDSDFSPMTMFDFGSGVGSGMWYVYLSYLHYSETQYMC